MPRSSRPRKAHRPQRVAANAMLIAVNGVQQLHRRDVQRQMALLRLALDEFRRGLQCSQHWRSLADAGNVTETLSAMGLCAGADADRVIRQAQQALHDVALRHRALGTWALRHDELDALDWLLSLHARQLQECDYSEFSRAMDRTHTRVAQARAGNAPAGAVVVVGDIT